MSIPTISLARLNDGNDLDQLASACTEWGFFKLIEHGISPSVCKQTLDAMEQFFALPTSAKRAIERTKDNPWGFYDRELTKNVKDHKEIFDVGPENDKQVPQWPGDVPEFKHRIERFYSASLATLQLLSIRNRRHCSPASTNTPVTCVSTTIQRVTIQHRRHRLPFPCMESLVSVITRMRAQ